MQNPNKCYPQLEQLRESNLFINPKVTVQKTIWFHLHQVCSTFLKLFQPVCEPIIRERRDRYGNPRWHVYNPVTGYTSVFHSLQEVHIWLEEVWYVQRRNDHHF